MFTPVPDSSPDLATALLIHYSFDLSGYSAGELIKRWQAHYPVDWLHLAVIEALYQGRYKAVSVQQILAFWQRRGQAIYHFNMEFERMICSKFPESLTAPTTLVLPPAKRNFSSEKRNPQLTSTPRKTPPLQLVSSEEKPLPSEEIESNITTPAPQPSSNSEGIRSLASQLSTIPHKLSKLLPPAVNQRKIGQFTPEKSDRSDSFTSKLKAISSEQVSPS
ncbi:hypothetical protein [Fortiea contorta]|uniref:hypothetical protein n=1 Tax=Fortiea contorta TaxID=1892405 RepID=UPI00034A6A61|nr:hypothetical protein [Fortiea contorta]